MKLTHLFLSFSLHSLLLHVQAFSGGLEHDTYAIERRNGVGKRSHSKLNRRMIAARPASNLEPRAEGSDSPLRHNHILHFIDDGSPAFPMSESVFGSQSQFASQVHLKSSLPTLLLEESDHILNQVICHKSIIELQFREDEDLLPVWVEVLKHPEIIVITSHPSCNADGERKPYLVSNVARTGRSLILSGKPTSWKHSFHSIDVGFGSRDRNDHLERHDSLRKRQAAPTSTGAASLSSSEAAAALASISFPSAPSASPTDTSVHAASINKAWIDTAILPPDFPGVDGASLHGPFVPQGINISCKNCTIQGDIDLIRGSFTTDQSSNDSNRVEEAEDFYENGYLELAVNNFSAYIELQTTFQASKSLYLYTAPFPDIGIPGFVIPGIAEVGPVLRPRVTFGVQLATELAFTYGFNLSIPNNSSVVLNIKNPENSTISGFAQTQIAALPFQTDIDSVNLTLSVAFNPQILLTISFLDGDGSFNAGAFLDLPKIQATIAEVDHVDSKCNPANTTDSAKDFLFDSLTNIVPALVLDVGVLANARLEIDDFSVEEQAIETLTSLDYPLPTACIRFDPLQKTWGSPTATGGNR